MQGPIAEVPRSEGIARVALKTMMQSFIIVYVKWVNCNYMYVTKIYQFLSLAQFQRCQRLCIGPGRLYDYL